MLAACAALLARPPVFGASARQPPPACAAHVAACPLPACLPAVLLHNDSYNRREYVVQVLMKVGAAFGWLAGRSRWSCLGCRCMGRAQRPALPCPQPADVRHSLFAVPQVVEGTTVDDAVNIMNEAHINGLALVAQVAQVRGRRRGRRTRVSRSSQPSSLSQLL